VEADLLLHLAEIDSRRLYLDYAHSSMITFCVRELGFSEGAAFNRITVARAVRELPAILDAVRANRVHLAGVRLLLPLLTEENQRALLSQASGKSKREIEELVARLAPEPSVPDVIRKLPTRAATANEMPSLFAQRSSTEPSLAPEATSVAPLVQGGLGIEITSTLPGMAHPQQPRAVIAPLSEDAYKVQFTASRALRDKLRHAQDLLRHRVPGGDLAQIFDKALDLLIEKVETERFAKVRKPRETLRDDAATASSRHIPDAIKRAVHERDGGRCAFVDERGKRCEETGGLEFDHIEGFARTHVHEVDKIRLLCIAHNGHAAEQIYGRAYMEAARRSRVSTPALPGKSAQAALF
jgi:hypothetical protein